MSRQQISVVTLLNLKQRLDLLPSRCPERTTLISETASLYGISRNTLYRLLRELPRPQALRRRDR